MPTKLFDLGTRIFRLLTGASRNRIITCRLFNDMVTDQLCRLRKQELHSGDFSCRGCKRQ